MIIRFAEEIDDLLQFVGELEFNLLSDTRTCNAFGILLLFIGVCVDAIGIIENHVIIHCVMTTGR